MPMSRRLRFAPSWRKSLASGVNKSANTEEPCLSSCKGATCAGTADGDVDAELAETAAGSLADAVGARLCPEAQEALKASRHRDTEQHARRGAIVIEPFQSEFRLL